MEKPNFLIKPLAIQVRSSYNPDYVINRKSSRGVVSNEQMLESRGSSGTSSRGKIRLNKSKKLPQDFFETNNNNHFRQKSGYPSQPHSPIIQNTPQFSRKILSQKQMQTQGVTSGHKYDIYRKYLQLEDVNGHRKKDLQINKFKLRLGNNELKNTMRSKKQGKIEGFHEKLQVKTEHIKGILNNRPNFQKMQEIQIQPEKINIQSQQTDRSPLFDATFAVISHKKQQNIKQSIQNQQSFQYRQHYINNSDTIAKTLQPVQKYLNINKKEFEKKQIYNNNNSQSNKRQYAIKTMNSVKSSVLPPIGLGSHR